MSNHCRRIWPRVVCTSSKTATRTVTRFLFCVCFAAEKPRAMTTCTVHNVRALVCSAIMHPDKQHYSISKSVSLSHNNFSLSTSFPSLSSLNRLPNAFFSEATINNLAFPCLTSYLRGREGFSSNIWMLASLSKKSYQIRSHYNKFNLKAYHLFI